MKSIVIALAAGAGILLVPALQATAAPANGARSEPTPVSTPTTQET